MGLLDPTPLPYDPLQWDRLPFPEKARAVCEAWALQGYGAPPIVFLAYALKIGLYVAGWLAFCVAGPGLGDLANISQWWAEPLAFQKAILWSLLFEVLGLGCGSGPLTGRYLPPLGGVLHFVRPGTTRAPVWPAAPLLGGHLRSVADVVAYVGILAATLHALLGVPNVANASAIVVLTVLLGLRDRTVFLAARSEHYVVTALLFALSSDWLAGAKSVHLALWLFAGLSKLNHHFPAVVCVMTSNSPLVRSERARKRMYRDHPDDLRPSRFAVALSVAGVALELAVPLVFLLAPEPVKTPLGLTLMVLLHAHITSSVPMGVPLEWNVMMLYGGFFLFGAHADVSVLDAPPAIAAVVLVASVFVPILGNLRPDKVSFLPAMRYYAGNWGTSVWLFRRGSETRLERLKKSSPWVFDQLAHFYDEATRVGMVGKVIGFRLMHLHGRAIAALAPRLVDDLRDYHWMDGEIVAGMVLGWNFGDGHLHDERLLEAVQAQCDFAPGELRCVFVESQPVGCDTLHWRLADAADGPLDAGHASVRELLTRAPWSTKPLPPEK